MRLLSSERIKERTAMRLARFCLPLLVILGLALFTALFFGLGTSNGLLPEYLDASCSASGHFHLATESGARYNPYWQGSLFLSITLGFGNLTYAWAKGIDVCWDLFVGRGGQALLCLLAYPVIRRSLFGYMERAPVRIPVYAAIAFDKFSLRTLGTLVQDAPRSSDNPESSDKRTDVRPARATWKWRCVGFSLIIIYILTFPTLVSVMTGYQAKYIPYVQRPDNHFLVRFQQLWTPPLVVRDGHRVGLHSNHVVQTTDPNYNTLLAYAGTKIIGTLGLMQNLVGHQVPCFNAGYFDFNTTMLVNTTGAFNPGAILQMVVYGNNDSQIIDLEEDANCSLMLDLTSSTWTSSTITLDRHPYHLDEPPLDISVQTGWLLGYTLSTIRYLAVDDLALSINPMQLKGSCQPADRYVWGFSSLLLFVFCISTVLFATVLASLHCDSLWSTRTDRCHYDVNLYRDAVSLVYELQDRFFGDDLRNMSARDLKKELEGSSKGICLESSELPLCQKEERHQRRLADGTGPFRHLSIVERVKYGTLVCVGFLKTAFTRDKTARESRMRFQQLREVESTSFVEPKG